MRKSYSNTFVARIAPTETQCQQGKCRNKARFIKYFLTKDNMQRRFQFCARHLSTKIKGYKAQNFILIVS